MDKTDNSLQELLTKYVEAHIKLTESKNRKVNYGLNTTI